MKVWDFCANYGNFVLSMQKNETTHGENAGNA